MLFDRHRKLKRLEDPATPKKSSFADAFFRRLPIAFTRRTRSKTSLLSATQSSGLTTLPRQSTSLPNVTIEAYSPVSPPRLDADGLTSSLSTAATISPARATIIPTRQHSYKRQRCVTTNSAHLNYHRHSLIFNDLRIEKRHSIEPKPHRVSKLIGNESNTHSNNKQRHSYTFGKQGQATSLSLKDLVLNPSQERKLDLFLEQRQLCSRSPPLKPNSAGSVMSTLETPTIIIPQRSVSQQLLSPPKHHLVRAHSTSSSSIHQQDNATQYNYSSLDATTLADMLDRQNKEHMNNIMLIDVRNLVEFQKQRIRGSLNVNLPSLLIKRYQRGAVSNFHLENFITTAEGREQYLAQRSSLAASGASTATSSSVSASVSPSTELVISTLSSSPSSLSTLSTVPQLSPGSSTSSASSCDTKCSLAEVDGGQSNNNVKKSTIWVVYDDDMNDQHKATQAWTLLNVLCKATSETDDQIHYLNGGFYGFIDNRDRDIQQWIEGTENHTAMNFNQHNYDSNGDIDMDSLHQLHSNGTNRLTLSTSTSSETASAQQKHFSKVSPRRSFSYTVGDRSKGQQQTSLFSLDTQAARENNANALARRASRRSQQLQQQRLSISTTSDNKKRLSSAAMGTLQQKATAGKKSDDSNTQHHESKSIAGDNKITNTPLLHIPASRSSSTQKQTSSIGMQSLSLTTATSLSSAPTSSSATFTSNSNAPPPLARVTEEEDDDDDMLRQMTADISPRTETDFDFTISEIIPGFLYVGPEIETNDQADQLLARPIRRVLNMAEECHDQPLQHHDDLVYRKIAARDTVEMRNIDHVMMEAVGFIEEAKRYHEPIYVHCKAGKSRSVTAILAYLVSCERWTLKQSYRHVIKARPNMSPNIGFIAELMKLENQVHGRVSSFMETDWHSASLPSPEFSHKLEQLQLAWESTPAPQTRSPSPSLKNGVDGTSYLL